MGKGGECLVLKEGDLRKKDSPHSLPPGGKGPERRVGT